MDYSKFSRVATSGRAGQRLGDRQTSAAVMLRKNPPAAILLALAFVPTLSGFASSGENLQLSSAANGLRCFEAAPARDRHALSRCSPEHTRAEGVESGARSRGDSVPGRWANHCREAGSDRAEGQGLAGARDAMLYLRGGGQEEEDETQKVLSTQSLYLRWRVSGPPL